MIIYHSICDWVMNLKDILSTYNDNYKYIWGRMKTLDQKLIVSRIY